MFSSMDLFILRDATPAECDIATAKSSVRLSVTLRYRHHIGWNSFKIISPLASLGCSLLADPNMIIADLQRNTLKF